MACLHLLHALRSVSCLLALTVATPAHAVRDRAGAIRVLEPANTLRERDRSAL